MAREDRGTDDRSEAETVGPDAVMETIRDLHGEDVAPAIELEPGSGESGGRHRYAVGEEIARGGMGAILQVRDRDLRRTLAMKVLLGDGGEIGGPAKREHIERFLEEAQVTAQLSHPGVVPVHELGIDSTGRVFFTMSLVRGRTLCEVFDLARAGREGWNVPRAVQTLLRVCETMAFAHSKGVVHRDLKPGNVMVGDFGQVYVMDWGLAKVADYEHSHDIRLQNVDLDAPERITSRRTDTPESPLMTADGAVLGTPCYMPPEQARGQVEEVDAQSDVYAIGAMLYQLLTGRPPYTDPRRSLPPLTILLHVHRGAPAAISGLAPQAPPELVAIAEKAMARDKASRYGAAADLADDLQRFLSGHVVRAYRTGALVELQKWVQRNRAVAATAAASLLLLATGTAAFVSRLDVAKRDAESARARAEDLASFMLFDLRDRLEPIGKLELLEAVALEAKGYYDSLPAEEHDPAAQRRRAFALANLGDVQRELGDLPAATASHAASLTIRQRLSRSSPDNATWLRDLAASHDRLGETGLAQGDLEAAARNFEAMHAITTRLSESAPAEVQGLRDLSASHLKMGTVRLDSGDVESASQHYATALAIADRLARTDDTDENLLRDLSVCHDKVGNVRQHAGRLEQAARSFEESLAIRRRLLQGDPDDPERLRDLTVSLEKVGAVRLEDGDADGALQHFTSALEIAKRLAEADSANTMWAHDLALSHEHVGEAQLVLGDPEAAARNYEASLAIVRRLAESDPANSSWARDVAQALARVADVRLAAEDFEEALRLYASALDISERLAASDPANATWQRNLTLDLDRVADVCLELDRLDEAMRRYRASLAISERLSAADPSSDRYLADLAVGHENIGWVHEAAGRFDEAALSFERSLELHQRLVERDPTGADRWRELALAHYRLGLCAQAGGAEDRGVGRFAEAVSIHAGAVERASHLASEHGEFEEALRRAELLAGVRRPETVADHLDMGYAWQELERWAASASCFELALAEETARADLGRANLYNAACAAARAVASGDESWRSSALAWLGDDLRRRRRLLAAALAGRVPAGGDGASRLEELRDAVRRHVEWARTSDPDLSAIRGTPAFDALFEGSPGSPGK